MKVIVEKCRKITTEEEGCEIELNNQFDYKLGYWVSSGDNQILKGVSWFTGYPHLRTNLVVAVKFQRFVSKT